MTCEGCGQLFLSQALWVFGRAGFWQRHCTVCMSREKEAAAAQREKEADAARESIWMEVCPVIYRDTNPSDSRLDRAAVQAAQEWPVRSARGLAFVGPTGRGKTRCLFLALRRAHSAGSSTAAISHNRFSKAVVGAFAGDADDKARSKALLRRLAVVDVLLLDDLGKAPSTERVDAELEEIVETRTSVGLPILWSANGSGQWLMNRFGPDRGEPLVRRLSEFCEVQSVR